MNTPAEAAAASIASKATTTGGGVALVAGLTSHDVIAWAGLAVAVGGFLLNWYFKHKADQRATALFEARMERVKAGRRTDTDLVPLGEDD